MSVYFGGKKIGQIIVKIESDENKGYDTSDATLQDGAQMLEGVTAYGANGKVTGSIPSQGAQTITPSETAQEIAAGKYLSGKQTIEAIPSTYVGSGVTKQAAKTVTPSESTQTAVAAGVYTTGIVQVDAISSTYVGSAVTRQSAKTVTPSTSEQTAVQAGVYTEGEVKVSAMPSGALGTPTVDSAGLVTAQVSTSGYLASGTAKTLQLATQGAKTVTPSDSEQVAVEAGVYTTGQVKVAAAASSGGSLPSTITAGDTAVLSSSTLVTTIASTSMTATGISITIPKAGTYRFKFSCGRTSTSSTWTTQLYKNGSAISGATVTWSNYQGTYTGDISCDAGDVIQIYARSRSTSYRNIVGQLVACIDWDNGF